MKQITLKTVVRGESGRAAARQIRNEGAFPAVIYGESGVRHLQVDAHAFKMGYRNIAGSAALIELEIEGEESSFAIIQEIQRNTRTDEVLHVDFKEIVRGKEMEADIPVKTSGIALGVKNYGGILEVSASELRVRCRPRNLPEAIVVDVSNLEIGKSMHLSEVEAPEGVTLLGDSDQVIAACVGASGGSDGTEAEEATAEATA